MQDIPKLYTALAEWLAVVVMIMVYRKIVDHSKRARHIIALSCCLVLLGIIQTLCGLVSNFLWLCGMAAAVIVMIMAVRYVLELRWNAAAYLCARAFMFAEFTAAAEWQLFAYFFYERRDENTEPERTMFCLVFYAIAYAAFYFLERRILSPDWEKSWLSATQRQLILTWLMTIIMFTFGNLSYLSISTPFTGTGVKETYNIRTMVDLAGFMMLEAFYILKNEADREKEMGAIRNLLNVQYVQYRESQENIDLINRKYHDLKHQLQVIRQESDSDRRNAYLDEIEGGIRRYESEYKTGNTVLDTVLTGKGEQCLKYNITMTVVADGTLLNHIAVMDLCTIFGNALDNAIEYEVLQPQKDKRLIHVTVSARANLVCVVIENYYEGPLDGGIRQLPQTTKQDKQYHGYGLKSIRSTVYKYGGQMNMKVQDHWFRLEMILPAA